MWWEPQNGMEAETSVAIRAMLSLKRRPPFLHGIGSALNEMNERVVLLAVVPPSKVVLDDRVLVPLAEDQILSARLAESGLECPRNSLLVYSSSPVALCRPGCSVWTRNKTGTVGFQIRIGGQPGFMTVGHLAGQSASVPFDIFIRRGWLKRRFEPAGRITFYNDPIAGPGIDVAVGEYRDPPQDGGGMARLAFPSAVTNLTRVTVHGGKSGIRFGWICGALKETWELGGRCWSNCWLTLEIDGGFAQDGDSGAPVFVGHDDRALGQLVAVQGVERRSGLTQGGLVQDIGTCIGFLENTLAAPVIVSRPA